MSEDNAFHRWWADPIKHHKRRHYWIPHAKKLCQALKGVRGFRYFTLCSREMIDVFCLIKEKLITFDPALQRIDNVRFCEYDRSIYPEIKEIIGREDSGFLGRLEEISLYQDDAYTRKFPLKRDIDVELNKLGEGITKEKKQRLDLKLEHLRFEQAFPFDFLNLDFCGLYYPLPDIMQINSTVEQLVKWQSRLLSENGKQFSLKRFLVAVTCRFDDTISRDAYNRLEAVLAANRNEYSHYRIALERYPLRKNLRKWRKDNPLDFFLSSWPKELLQIMEDNQWKMEICGLVYYDRVGETGKKFKIVSLLCECVRHSSKSMHEEQSVWLLESMNRQDLSHISKTSKAGKQLYADLRKIVELRNRQAKIHDRALLPPI